MLKNIFENNLKSMALTKQSKPYIWSTQNCLLQKQ